MALERAVGFLRNSKNKGCLHMLKIADFIRDFYRKLHEVVPEDLKRELNKYERVVKHALYMVVGQYDLFHKGEAPSLQERFHIKMDQMVSDYQTWKRGGCKAYAKPKQYVSGKIAGASKKAFDLVLNTYLVYVRDLERAKERKKIVALYDEGDDEPDLAA